VDLKKGGRAKVTGCFEATACPAESGRWLPRRRRHTEALTGCRMAGSDALAVMRLQ